MKNKLLAVAALFLLPAIMPLVSGQVRHSEGMSGIAGGFGISARNGAGTQNSGGRQNPDRGRGYRHHPRPSYTNPNLYDAPLPRDLEGETWSRHRLENRVVVLNFWATWCAPCLDQIPEVRTLYDNYSRDDLILLGVNLDSGGNRSLRRWLRLNRNRVTWPQLFNRGGFNGELPGCYGIKDVPVLLVFNRKGELEFRCQSARCAREAVTELMKK